MKLLITAGPTRERIDAVRFIGNRSSGKMGLALAAAAVEARHDTTLLLGPGMDDSAVSSKCRVYRFESTAELQQLLGAHWPDNDALLMAAAVADYRPASVHEGKLPRGEAMVLHLEPTPDLVAMCAAMKKPKQRVIAFALEERESLEKRAAEKMKRKGVDAIVANPVETMESDTITPVWLTAGGQRETLGRVSKADFARWLVAKVE